VTVFIILAMPKPKSPKVPGQLRRIVAANVDLMAKIEFRERPNVPLALAHASGVSKSTVQRIISGDVGADLETLEKVAKALGLIPYQLFIPNLDVKNPQVAKGAMPGEYRAYRGTRLRQV
jgi:transcriptional regulator with XRE-family HTH domain